MEICILAVQPTVSRLQCPAYSVNRADAAANGQFHSFFLFLTRACFVIPQLYLMHQQQPLAGCMFGCIPCVAESKVATWYLCMYVSTRGIMSLRYRSDSLGARKSRRPVYILAEFTRCFRWRNSSLEFLPFKRGLLIGSSLQFFSA